MNLLITGAGRGLGYELAAEALERGHAVIAGVRSPQQADGKLAKLAARHEGRLAIEVLDVADEKALVVLASRMKQEGRTLGAIINNAAILVARSTQIEELDMDDVAKSFDVNLYGPMRVVKYFLPLLTEKDASIINISSEAGSITNAYPGDYPYTISKTALNMFTEQLHVYLKDRDIQVLSIHPGWMRTDMGGEHAPTDPHSSAHGIIGQLERRTGTESKFHFVDYTGKAMPI